MKFVCSSLTIIVDMSLTLCMISITICRASMPPTFTNVHQLGLEQEAHETEYESLLLCKRFYTIE